MNTVLSMIIFTIFCINNSLLVFLLLERFFTIATLPLREKARINVLLTSFNIENIPTPWGPAITAIILITIAPKAIERMDPVAVLEKDFKKTLMLS